MTGKLTNAMTGSALVLAMAIAGTATAAEPRPLADEIETPDVLLERSAPPDKQYGTDRIVIQKGGKKEDSQLTPDVLESSVTPTAPADRGEEVEVKVLGNTRGEPPAGEGKAAREKQIRFEREERRSKELITPDPLLDSVD